MVKISAKIFSDPPTINCEICNKNLLEDGNSGNYIVFSDKKKDQPECMKFACKEHDARVTARAEEEDLCFDGWEDIDDLLIPSIWIQRVMAFFNELRESNDNISDEYFNNVKQLILNTFPYVAREMGEEEIERATILHEIE